MDGMSDVGPGDMKSFVCGHTAGRKQQTPQAPPLTTALRPVRNTGCPRMPRPRDSSFPWPMSPSDPGGIPTGPCGHSTLLPPCTQLSTRVCCTHTTGDRMAITVHCACNTAHGPALSHAASPGLLLVTSFHRRSCFSTACKVKATGAERPNGSPSKTPTQQHLPEPGPGAMCPHRSLCPSWSRAEVRNEATGTGTALPLEPRLFTSENSSVCQRQPPSRLPTAGSPQVFI